jgi:hypothetical protein
MATMTTKQFIEVTFITQVGEIVPTHPYIAFMTMGIGIEFLGKCMNIEDFNEERVSRQRFEEALNHIPAFSKYLPLIGKGSAFDLYSTLRCGLAHAGAPKFPITLSSKDEMANLEYHDNGKRVNLRCEDFYTDFRTACTELFTMPEPAITKLAAPFLAIPDYKDDKLVVKAAITESLAR